MKHARFICQKPSRWIAAILILVILAPTMGPAQARRLAPEAVRSHVLKLGVGQWVRVREDSGSELNGRITGIGPQVFQMKQRDAAGPTFVYYGNVARIRRAQYRSGGGGDFPPGAWAGIAVVGAIFLALAICQATKCTKSAAQASW